MRHALMNYWLNDFDKSFFSNFPQVDSHRANKQNFLNQFFSVRVDVKETPESFLFQLDLPGVKKEEIQIELENRELTITGERKIAEDSAKETKVHLEERIFGKFERKFSLPETVDSSKVDAVFKDGVLTLTLGKKIESQPKVISIKVN